ncbi:MAG TPA: hypothetical protein ENK14_02015 [Caldithrix sp.]|nr:hypothetical protein [Caldithrix sp.]
MKIIALIGDILSSREVPERNELQQKLDRTLSQVNRSNPALLSPYTITLGDEFQAVYRNADSLFEDIWQIMLGIFPQKIRFSIAVGTLSTPINRRQAIGMDGPAFHFAREGIQQLKKTSYLFKLSGEAFPEQELINYSLNLISADVNNWEKNRMQILVGLLLGKKRKDLAEQLGISNVAVYKNIRAGALEAIIGIGRESAKLINRELAS